METLLDNYRSILAIDPGMTGSVAVYQKGHCRAHKAEQDMQRFEMLLDLYNRDMRKVLVFIEDVKLWKSDTHGKQFRMQKLILHADRMKQKMIEKKIPFIEVPPITWQKWLKIHVPGEDYEARKQRYYEIANKKFPHSKVRKYSADAYLILLFGTLKMKYDPKWVEERLPLDELSLF